MKEKLLKAIKENPGYRVSILAWIIKEPKLDVIAVLSYLEDADLVYHKTHNDFANMEFYDEWYINDTESSKEEAK